MSFQSRRIWVAVSVAPLILAAAGYAQAPAQGLAANAVRGDAALSDAAFQKDVVPVLAKTCSPCHNSQMASGGLNVANFQKRGSLTENRDAWDVIARKIRSGEMPPAGIPRPA